MSGQAKSSGLVGYLGRHLRGVDGSLRVLLPSEWRPNGGAPQSFTVLLWPPEAPEYLLVVPPDRWTVVLGHLAEIDSLGDEEASAIERAICSSAYPKSLDTAGRLPLPDEAAKVVGIKQEVMLVGRISKFDVWAPDRYASYVARPDTRQYVENYRKKLRL